MTTRRRPLGSGPASHVPHAQDAGDGRPDPAALRVRAADADLAGGTLYRADSDVLADLRARGVLAWRPPSGGPTPGRTGRGSGQS
ncbi:hypothetical protein [Streptomyces sp. NPDC001108]